jgi:acyl-CoA thioester hydrolase
LRIPVGASTQRSLPLAAKAHYGNGLETIVQPPRPDDFPIRVTDIIRFGDLDRQGHVNNAVYSTYFETGRVGLIYDPEGGLQVAGATSVVARVEIDFLRELRWPGTVEVCTAVDRIGRTSYRFVHALFHADACAATGLTTMVLIDRETRRARPLPPELVQRLEALQRRR